MERREFLKDVIGLVAGTDTAWIAQSPVYRTPTADRQIAHMVRALHLKKSKLREFKGVCVTDLGQELWAPRVNKVKTYNTKFGHCVLVTWSFVPIELEQTVKVNTVKIIDDLGYLIQVCPLDGETLCFKGDTFTINDVSIFIK